MSGFQHRFTPYFVLFIFLASSFALANGSLEFNQSPPQNLSFSPQQNYVIRLINYDPEITDLTAIENGLPNGVIQPEFNYEVSYDLDFANSSYENTINTFVDSIIEDDWTSELNRTALQEQKADFGRKDIFQKREGKAIDARKLEDYLQSNLPQTDLPDNNRFYIFVFNLTRVDTGQSHWLNATEIDLDSKMPRFWWRLEWDYPLNYDTKFPYAAFTEESDLAILDPTAFQWYLTWRIIWNKDVDTHETYNQTLSELLLKETSFSTKSSLVTDTVVTWLQDWLANIFNIYTQPLQFGTSVDIQLLVVYDSTQKDKSELEWIINNDQIIETTNFILKSDDLTVTTTYVDQNQDSYMSDYLHSKEVNYNSLQSGSIPFDDWTFYDGGSIWTDTNSEDTPLRINYFSPSEKEISIYGTILLLDNASYVAHENFIPWSGGLYTGLGGDKTVTMLWELDRAFMPDGQSHKTGLSKVLIHEIGHAIGFPHTFSDSFISDFANDVMGYYPATANYSKIISSIYFRTAVDAMIKQVMPLYEDVYEDYISSDQSSVVAFYQFFVEAIENYEKKNYLEAWILLDTMWNDMMAYSGLLTTSTTSSSIPPDSSQGSTTTFLIFPFYSVFICVIATIPLHSKKSSK